MMDESRCCMTLRGFGIQEMLEASDLLDQSGTKKRFNITEAQAVNNNNNGFTELRLTSRSTVSEAIAGSLFGLMDPRQQPIPEIIMLLVGPNHEIRHVAETSYKIYIKTGGKRLLNQSGPESTLAKDNVGGVENAIFLTSSVVVQLNPLV